MARFQVETLNLKLETDLGFCKHFRRIADVPSRRCDDSLWTDVDLLTFLDGALNVVLTNKLGSRVSI